MAGVVAALSVVSDLARGHLPGEAMRACLLATELARRAGLDERRQGEVYYGTFDAVRGLRRDVARDRRGVRRR
jgi:hypothetical protein